MFTEEKKFLNRVKGRAWKVDVLVRGTYFAQEDKFKFKGNVKDNGANPPHFKLKKATYTPKGQAAKELTIRKSRVVVERDTDGDMYVYFHLSFHDAHWNSLHLRISEKKKIAIGGKGYDFDFGVAPLPLLNELELTSHNDYGGGTEN